MINFNLSFFPLVVLSLVNFVLSWIWYSPLLFAKPWMKALGIDEKHEMSEAEKRKMSFLFISGIVSSFLFVSVLMIIINSLQITDFIKGMLAGFIVWIGFVVTHSLNTLWEGRKLKVLIINNGLFCLTYILFGGIIAIWQ
jgi:hypothetical protein